MMNLPGYCRNCGHPIEADIKHCPMCGTPVEVQTSPFPQMPPIPPANPDGGKKNNSMMMSIIILLAVLVVGVAVCVVLLAKDDSKSEDTEIVAAPEIGSPTTDAAADPSISTTSSVEEVNTAAASEPARNTSEYQYVADGKIGKYSIEMELNIGSHITGRYRYKRQNGAGGWLTLTGYTAGGNSFGMSEFDSKEENTGNFEGSYSITGDRLTMTGTMYNAKGQSFSFSASGHATE